MTGDGVTRWWIPLGDVHPASVRVEHLHAVVSGWLDGAANSPEHWDRLKPYSLSPPTERVGVVGFELSTLSHAAAVRLHQAVARPTGVRLGGQHAIVGRPQALQSATWDDLAAPTGARQWQLRFDTPTTFRKRNRSTPLPTPPSIFRGLSDLWDAFSGQETRRISRLEADEVWVSGIDGETVVVELSYRHRQRRRTAERRPTMTVAGFVGRLTLRCDDPAVAARVDTLLRFAPYAGVGAQRQKGLGVTRLVAALPGSESALGA